MAQRILGIDPGTNIMGFGLVEVSKNQAVYLEHGIRKFPANKSSVEKLGLILSETEELIARHQPDILAIEAPFFGKNVQSMLKLGRAQGVIMATGMSKGCDVFEYAPRKIKMSITGKGQASKEQVARMLHALMNIPEDGSLTLDATDALAVAFCHFLQMGQPNDTEQPKKSIRKRSGSGDWSSYLRNNPDREL
jgi:crossover junction endodeoxyribonuclease RuvC